MSTSPTSTTTGFAASKAARPSPLRPHPWFFPADSTAPPRPRSSPSLPPMALRVRFKCVPRHRGSPSLPAGGSITANPVRLRDRNFQSGWSTERDILDFTLSIVDPDAATAIQVPLTAVVSGTPQQLRLSQVGLTFFAVQGSSAPGSQLLQVLNTGTGSMPWTAKAGTLSGNNWLSVSQASGATVEGATPPSLSIAVNVAGLSAGSYYGQVDVTAPSADNSPQSAVVLLNILPPDGTPGVRSSVPPVCSSPPLPAPTPPPKTSSSSIPLPIPATTPRRFASPMVRPG